MQLDFALFCVMNVALFPFLPQVIRQQSDKGGDSYDPGILNPAGTL